MPLSVTLSQPIKLSSSSRAGPLASSVRVSSSMDGCIREGRRRMTSTVPYIGAMMSLLPKSEIRYTGILASVSVEECTISLARVRCYGTEGRSDLKWLREVPGSDKLHDYIVFKASDVKDLFVIDGGETTSGSEASVPIDDPAIVSQKAKGPISETKQKSEIAKHETKSAGVKWTELDFYALMRDASKNDKIIDCPACRGKIYKSCLVRMLFIEDAPSCFYCERAWTKREVDEML